MRRRLSIIGFLAGLAMLVSTLPAYAAPRTLVALGDSYGSGVGTFIYFPDGTSCYRSPFSYPAQIAAATGMSLTLAACSGATTSDVARQIPAVPNSTDYVTITVGGNDLGFAPVLSTCGLPGWLGNCNAAIDSGLAILNTTLPDRLDDVYSAVRSQATNAKVVVTGYPLLFNGTDCNVLTFFTGAEMARLNDATARLNAVIQERAKVAGFTFVPAASAFNGHAWCDPQPWINGLTISPNSFHPNISGHSAYARLVGPALFGTPTARSTATLAADQVRLPSVTSARGPARIQPPDLSSPAVARAAARAGVTNAELKRLRNAQRSGVSNAALDRLDAKITAKAAQRLDAR